MKKAGIFFATSIAAASSLVSSSSYDCRAGYPFDSEGSSYCSSNSKEAGSGSVRGGETDTFAPKFDGLRFIETLVTAHR